MLFIRLPSSSRRLRGLKSILYAHVLADCRRTLPLTFQTVGGGGNLISAVSSSDSKTGYGMNEGVSSVANLQVYVCTAVGGEV